jgi:hypothetical protein
MYRVSHAVRLNSLFDSSVIFKGEPFTPLGNPRFFPASGMQNFGWDGF